MNPSLKSIIPEGVDNVLYIEFDDEDAPKILSPFEISEAKKMFYQAEQAEIKVKEALKKASVYKMFSCAWCL